jgi:Tol biopolymer transport system component
MSDWMDADFDAGLRARVRAYADDAVGAFDAAAVAREAIATPRRRAIGAPHAGLTRTRATLLAAAALIIALLAVVLAAGTSRPPMGDVFSSPLSIDWSPDGSKLAFFVDVGERSLGTDESGIRASHHELWVVSADGSGRSLVARLRSDGIVQPVHWSPDSRQLAYTQPRADSAAAASGSDIAVVGLDGTPARVLADAGAEGWIVGWSPTGDRLLYNRSDGSGSDIYTVSVDGTPAQRLTTTHEASADAWSPDGARILYTDGAVLGTQTSHSGTWVMRADGSAKALLGPCCDVGWSADGARAYFEAETGSLLSASVDGTDVRPLVNNHVPNGWALAPDGARYATATETGIEVARLGESPVRLTTDAGDGSPSWSADGLWIAFWGRRAGTAGLYVVRADGGPPVLVGADAVGGVDPWQATQNGRLAFVRDRAIVTVDRDGSDQRELVPRAAIAGPPRAPATGDSTFQDTMILGPDGPDRDIYRILVGPQFAFTFDNRTDVPWVVTLEGFDISAEDCRVIGSGAIVLAAYQGKTEPPRVAPATPPDYCLVPPHRAVSIDKPASIRGPADVRVARSVADVWTGYPVIFDLEGRTE